MFCFFKSESQVFLNGGNICEDQKFNLVFEDDFDGPLDQTDWYTYFPYGEGNSDDCSFCRTHDDQIPFGEGQIYLDENVRTEGGKLIFDVKNEPATWFNQSKNYTSGMIHGKKHFGYGKFEIRCKIPDGYAHFPAFWVQAGNHEIDIFESWGPENGPTDKFKCSVHNYNVETSDFWVEPEIDLSLDFHTY